MDTSRCGICKIRVDGTVLHKSRSAMAVCNKNKEDKCPLVLSSEFKQRNTISNKGFINCGISEIDGHHIEAIVLQDEGVFTVFTHDAEPEFRRIIPANIFNSLTKSEKIIVEKVLYEESNKSIADSLYISLSTLKTHLNHIYEKLPALLDWRTRRRLRV